MTSIDLGISLHRLEFLTYMDIWASISGLACKAREKKWTKRLSIIGEKLKVTSDEVDTMYTTKQMIDKKVDTIETRTVQTLIYLRDEVHLLKLIDAYVTAYFPSTKEFLMDQYQQELEYDITYEALIASELKYLCGGGSEEARTRMETTEFRAMCERHHVDKDLRVVDALLTLRVVADLLH